MTDWIKINTVSYFWIKNIKSEVKEAYSQVSK